jgi:quercetin dioxygenase-like cupin family protein
MLSVILNSSGGQNEERNVSIQSRVVVTGRDGDGKSVFVSDELTEPVTLTALPGVEFHQLWGTEDGVPKVGIGTEAPTHQPFFPGPGGTRFLFIRFAPSPAADETVVDMDEVLADAAAKLPGMIEKIEPESAGMHTTDTIDYAVCLEGELCLELDDGAEVRLTPGTTIVQRGTRHAWYNRSDKPALVCYVIIGAERTP